MSQYFAALFSRRPNDGWFRAGRYDVTTVDILTALAAFAMLLSISSLWDYLPFSTFDIRRGQIWRLFTWPIAERLGLFAIIGVAFFWSFGQQVEALFGKVKFAIWTSLVTLVPAFAITALSFLGSDFGMVDRLGSLGLSQLFLAAVWVYAATYPQVKFFEVIPIWAVALVFTLLRVYSYSPPGILFVLVSVATALTVGRSLGLASAWPIPHIPLGSGSSGIGRSSGRPGPTKPTKPQRPKRGSTGPRVVEGPWRSETAAKMPPPPGANGASPADQAELDGLLDKIGSNGMDALSGPEKQRLNELSKRLRNR